MDDQQQFAAFVICAALCADKKTKKKKRVWVKTWRRRRHCGLFTLQKELEVEDISDFRHLMRMTSVEFDALLGKVQPLISRQHTKLRLAITARERLSLTLRFLATGESFKSLSFQYRVGASTVSSIVSETCEALHQVLKDDFLRTPTTEAEWCAVAEEFQRKWQFPNCLGALDGKHIQIQAPAKSGSTFRNYKSRFSVLMMAVVDANCRFLYVSAGTQGRASDGGLFAHSDFYRALERGLLHIPPPKSLPNTDVGAPFMFVGDDAYPLRTDLMKPYSHRQLDEQQRLFNYRLSRARRVVENAFGILANRWRVFRTTILLHPDKVTKITLAAVCLHNFLQDSRSEAYIPPGLADREDAGHRVVEGDWRREGLGPLQPLQGGRGRNYGIQAKQQRDTLRDYFVSPAGLVPWQDAYV